MPDGSAFKRVVLLKSDDTETVDIANNWGATGTAATGADDHEYNHIDHVIMIMIIIRSYMMMIIIMLL